jgi:C-terminal processing protease CtpA/Prc
MNRKILGQLRLIPGVVAMVIGALGIYDEWKHQHPQPAATGPTILIEGTATKAAATSRKTFQEVFNDFDGHEIYTEAAEAIRDAHIKQISPLTRLKFSQEWLDIFEHDELHSEAGLNLAIHKLLWSQGERFDAYLDLEATQRELEQIDGQFIGVGLPLDLQGKGKRWQELLKKGKISSEDLKALETLTADSIVVVRQSPADGTPAQKAGITKGDRLLAIDGVKLQNLEEPQPTNYKTVVKRLRGELDSHVKVTLERIAANGKRETFDADLVRTVIRDPVVTSGTLGDHDEVAYIKLTNFLALSIPEQLPAALKLAAQKTATIIDLRDNPGGKMEMAQLVMQMLIDSGQVLKTTKREGDFLLTETYTLTPSMVVVEGVSTDPAVKSEYEFLPRSYRRILPLGKPVVLLVNGASGSSTEIVVGAMQETARENQASGANENEGPVVVIGEPTVGKGESQTVINIDNGRRLLHLTTGRFMPGGKNINWIGIVPDIAVDQPEDDGASSSDLQLNRALEEIKNIVGGRPTTFRAPAEIETIQAQLKKANEEKFAREIERREKQLKRPTQIQLP